VSTLKKADVERMLADYDRDPVGALTGALRVALDEPTLEWTALVKKAGFDCATRIRLQAEDTSALDALLIDLNELRHLPQET
jgi:hypothetical protein